jgi:hypothetical protein
MNEHAPVRNGNYERDSHDGCDICAAQRRELLTRRLNRLRDEYRNGRFWPDEEHEEP